MKASDPEEMDEALASMTPDQVDRGLFPRTLDDLRFRGPLFSRMTRRQAEIRKKAKPKKA